jgi:methylated-DNA-[protein]-cysteine S-methyltransferase
MPDLSFFQEYLTTEIGRLILLTDEQDRLRVVDWEDHAARMHRLLRLHYGAGRVTVVDRGSRSAAWYSVNAYFAGELTAIHGLPVETGGTVFQRSVWAALRKIPVGQTLSYRALATRLRCPKAVRAWGEPRGHSRAVSSHHRLGRVVDRIWWRGSAQTLAAQSRRRGARSSVIDFFNNIDPRRSLAAILRCNAACTDTPGGCISGRFAARRLSRYELRAARIKPCVLGLTFIAPA